MKTNKKECPHCGSTMRLVPAGISKTGKKYNAFWVCDVCGQTVSLPATPITSKEEFRDKLIEKRFKEKQERIEKLHSEKQTSIKILKAYDLAVNILNQRFLNDSLGDLLNKIEMIVERLLDGFDGFEAKYNGKDYQPEETGDEAIYLPEEDDL